MRLVRSFLLHSLVAVLALAHAEDLAFELAQHLPTQNGVRIKDLCSIEGASDEQLHGIGIVTGLDGTGDKNSATVGMLRQVLASKQQHFSEADLSSKNVAMVMVTATLPAFARPGQRIDATISSIGDAKSLAGGQLLQTGLAAPNGDFYAVAQGSLTVSRAGNQTVASLADATSVLREVPVRLMHGDAIHLVLDQADFINARRIADILEEHYDAERVDILSAGAVALRFLDEAPTTETVMRTISDINELSIVPDMEARVVINARTGTVVVGNHVRITPCAISTGNLTLRVLPIEETLVDPEDPARTITRRRWMNPGTGLLQESPPDGVRIDHRDVPGNLTVIDGSTVEAISNALNALGTRPADLVALFEALHRSGALHAKLLIL